MKLIAISGLLLLVGCASAPARRPETAMPAIADPAAPDLGGILRLIGKEGWAHACPVSEAVAYTAAHVMEPTKPGDRVLYEFSNAYGDSGAVRSGRRSPTSDIMTVLPVNGAVFARFYRIAAGPPSEGDQAWFIGFDFRTRDETMATRVFHVRVLRTVANHFVFYPSGAPGSSGSCVLNAAGEVLGINTAGRKVEDGKDVGMAVGVWGLR
jgi:hypothetical protein